ncbi:hypothetical protein ACFWCF_11850 [Rhodococcus sp. NPDC060090]
MELFFDLCFIVAIIQASAQLVHAWEARGKRRASTVSEPLAAAGPTAS